MARILYGISGEGLGHAIRSKAIISQLVKHHEIYIVTSRLAYTFLSENFGNVHHIHCMRLIYKKNAVHHLQTFFHNLIRFPIQSIKTYLKIKRLIKTFKPDVIITDFEPFSHFAARLHNLPIISVDNQHIVTKTDIEFTKDHPFEFFMTKSVINTFIKKTNYYLITTFFYPKVKDPSNTLLVGPILRKEILSLKPKKRDYIILYQTSQHYTDLIPMLENIPEKFLIYTPHPLENRKNIIFKTTHEKNFIRDLANCKAIITNGGFTLMSEALYLKKPVLSIPVKGQFEQILNAAYLKECHYGDFQETLTPNGIKRFLSKLPSYEQQLRKYPVKAGNNDLIQKLDSLIITLIKNSKVKIPLP